MTKLPEIMRGVLLTGHGGFEELQVRDDIPVPKPSSHEVLVRISASAINNTDINTRIGWYSKSDGDGDESSWSGNTIQFPRIQGADVCGRIVAVGDKVSEYRLNERVLIEPCIREVKGKILEQPWYFGSECNGGFCEYTVVDACHVYQVASELIDVELASFPCSYSTAENLLTRSSVTENDTVLVTGASGGVGSAAIQLAKARGASVIAVTSPTKVDELLALGADSAILRNDSLLKTLGKKSVDVVIDLVAGEHWPELLEVLKPSGRYAVSGAIGGPHVKLDVRTLYLKDLSFFGCTVLDKEVFSNLVRRIEQGNIVPLVAKRFPLENIVEAQQYFAEKKHTGKIVLSVIDQ